MIIVIEGNFRTAVYLSINKDYLLMSRCVLKLSTQVLEYSRAKLKHIYSA